MVLFPFKTSIDSKSNILIAIDEVAPVDAAKKSKKTKPVKDDTISKKPEEQISATTTKESTTKDKKAGKKAKVEKPKILAEEKAISEEGNDDVDNEDEIDDQTAALLEGFESDSDEEMDGDLPGFEKGIPVGKIPAIAEKAKKALKKSKKTVSEESEKPGVVYVGRLPHGFYEHEMREYFGQFGTITQLRMSRNKKTGSSRHYAFIEFESADVAEIVAKTMDNYLLFSHILKVKLLVDGQAHENMFVGANKRFKKVPWNKIRGRELEQGASEEQWGKRIEKENQRRSDKAAKMKEIGYEFQAPKIKSPEGVSIRVSKVLKLTETQSVPMEKPEEIIETTVLPTLEEAKVEALEIVAVIQQITKPSKKEKKTKKSKVPETSAEIEVEAIAVPAVKSHEKPKLKKSKKAVEVTISTVEAPLVPVIEELPIKKTKSKKEKKASESSKLVTEQDVVSPVAPVAEESIPKKTKAKKEKKLVEPAAAIVADADVVEEPPKTKKKKSKSKTGEVSEPKEDVAVPEVAAVPQTLEESSKAKKNRGDRGRKAKDEHDSKPAETVPEVANPADASMILETSKPKKKKSKKAKGGDVVA